MSSSHQAPAEEGDLQNVNAKLPAELKSWLERRAAVEDRSMSAIIRRALSEYRDRVEAA